MMSFIRPRWRKPAWIVLAGTVFAVALVIRGGQHWWLWVSLVAIVVAGRAFFLYVWAGEDDDVGALAGSRADERQKLLSLRSRAIAFNVTALAAFAVTVAIAIRASWWWPFASSSASRARLPDQLREPATSQKKARPGMPMASSRALFPSAADRPPPCPGATCRWPTPSGNAGTAAPSGRASARSRGQADVTR